MAKPKDLVLVHGRTPDGAGLQVLRARSGGLELGTMRPLEEGRAIHGEVVKLTPVPESPVVFEAETQYAPPNAGLAADAPNAAAGKTEPPARAQGRSRATGPAQVASDRYRKNWDAIWKRPGKRGSALN